MSARKRRDVIKARAGIRHPQKARIAGQRGNRRELTEVGGCVLSRTFWRAAGIIIPVRHRAVAVDARWQLSASARLRCHRDLAPDQGEQAQPDDKGTTTPHAEWAGVR